MFVLSSKLTRRIICQKTTVRRNLCDLNNNARTIENLQLYLDVPRVTAELIVLKHPSVTKYDASQMRQIVDTVQDLGINKSQLVNEPVIFSSLPITLRYRFIILQECGFHTITASNLSKYLNLVRQKTIKELKLSGLILPNTNVKQKLANIFTQWPTSRPTDSMQIDEETCSLQDLRMKILQRYLELVIDLPEQKFLKALNTYVRIRHRPLYCINETLMLLQKNVLMPNEKIRSNMFLIHADPEQLKQMLYKMRNIAGVDIKDIIKIHPKLCTTNIDTLMATQTLLEEYGVKKEAQIRCFEIYTLSTETVRERLERAKSIPEFKVLLCNPRMLRLIFYENKALKRLDSLYRSNKKCLSLHILSGSKAHYTVYEKSPGDRTKGRDLLSGIVEELGPKFNTRDLRVVLKRHPFWINVPLLHVKSVYKQLAPNFSSEDIFENSPILLYPWNKIEALIKVFCEDRVINQSDHITHSVLEHLDTSQLTKSQILSLTLYVLEKDHYFSGNGVWVDGKLNEIYTLDNKDGIWTNYSSLASKC